MNIIQKIGLKGVGPFKAGAVLEIPKGVSYLYGLNRMNEGNANYAGKSLFASTLGELLYEEPIIGLKQDRQRAGSRFVEYKQGRNTIRLASSFKGNKEQAQILVNGEDKSARTTKGTRELFKKAWPLTQTDYLSYGFLDSNLPHPLVRGSTNERKTFFTEFFRLNALDAERKIFQAELLKVKRVKAQYTELDRTFKAIKSDMLSRDKRIELEGRVSNLEGRLSKLQAIADRAQAVQRLRDFKTYAGTKLDKFNKLCPTLEEFASLVGELEDQIRKAEQSQEQLEDWKIYRREMKLYLEKTQGLDMSTDIEELRVAHAKYGKLNAQLDALDLTRPKKVASPSAPKTPKDDLVAAKYKVVHRLEHAKKFGEGKCYACGQPVKVEDAKALKSELTKINAQLDDWATYESEVEAFKEYTKAKEIYEEAIARKRNLESEVKALIAPTRLYEKRRNLAKPAKVERPSVVDAVDAKANLDLLKFFAPHLDTVKAIRKVSEDDWDLVFDAQEMNRLQERLSSYKAKLEVHKTVKTRATSILERLSELEAEAASEDALNLLVTAYSDKAIKKMVIESISQHLMQLVNRYASLVFDNYTFEFVWGTQIQILAHRPSGTTDVRKLSGAESKLFTIILVLSMLAFVPKKKRLSLLILDEPTASFSAKSVEQFHTLLPHLSALIPSILIVTPRSDERYADATEFTVLRTHQGAKIVKGHPYTL